MEKIDFKKTLKEIYQPPRNSFSIVSVPKMNFLTYSGKGNPNTSKDFQEGVESIYAVSYAIKMSPKRGFVPEGYFDYVVPPLEGLWWIKGEKFDLTDKDKFEWKIMIMQPDFINNEIFKNAIEYSIKNKGIDSIAKIKFEAIEEGLSVQILHIGSYDEEKETINKMKDFIKENNLKENGLHHEIYLSDPRKISSDKLKTILRQPVININ